MLSTQPLRAQTRVNDVADLLALQDLPSLGSCYARSKKYTFTVVQVLHALAPCADAPGAQKRHFCIALEISLRT